MNRRFFLLNASTLAYTSYWLSRSVMADANTAQVVNAIDYIPETERKNISSGVSSYDCTEAIQQALNDALRNKAVLVFGDGTYLVDPTRHAVKWPRNATCAFRLKSGMTLKGSGKTVFKVRDQASTEASPQPFFVFFSDEHISEISFSGIIFDGNWTNNKISPQRSANKYGRFQQAFIAIMGDRGRGDNIRISDCVFMNNAGENNIVMASLSAPLDVPLGKGWVIDRTSHIDGGMDAIDFSAIFAYADDVSITNNKFIQRSVPVKNNGPGARNAYEAHGSRHLFSNNTIENYFGGVIVSSNWARSVSDIKITNNKFINMFLYGVRLWRQKSREHRQAAVSDVLIADNTIDLSSARYASPTAYKAGIYGAANFSLAMESVTIRNNRISIRAEAENPSAGIYLITQSEPNEEHKNFAIEGNIIENTYSGVEINTAYNGATFGAVRISNNEFRNLKGIKERTASRAIAITGREVRNVEIKGNRLNTSGEAVPSIGMLIQGKVDRLDSALNDFSRARLPYSVDRAQIRQQNRQ